MPRRWLDCIMEATETPAFQRLPFPMAPLESSKHSSRCSLRTPQAGLCPFPDDGPNIFQQAVSSVSKAAVGSLVHFRTIPGAFVCEMRNMDRDVLTVAL